MTLDPPLLDSREDSGGTGPQSPLSRFVADYNPFYLLSAACMLFGVFALNDSLDWSPIGLRRLLTMIVTLNVYELAVIGLAVFLMRRGIRRDSLMLLIVEAFFLADVGFLNMEVFATNVKVGLLVNAIVFAAAVVKVALIFNASGIPLKDSRFAFVLIQLSVLFAIPGIFGAIAQPRNDFLPPLAVYAAWWLAGAMPVVYTMTVGSVDLFRKRPDGLATRTDVIVSRVLIVLPMLSMIAHLCLANWIYKVMFHPANLAPMLLGFAVLAGHADDQFNTRAARMRWALVLPFVAVALSAIKFPRELIFPITPGIDASPLRTALIVASVVYLEGLWNFRQAWFAVGSSACLAMATLGHSVGTINDNSIRMAKDGASVFDKLIPKTLAGWGMYSIGLSFVLLAIGALISLNRKSVVVEEVREE